MIPLVTDVPGHPDPDFKSTLIFYSFSINWFPFPLFGKYLLIFNIALRDHSSEKDFQACLCQGFPNFSGIARVTTRTNFSAQVTTLF